MVALTGYDPLFTVACAEPARCRVSSGQPESEALRWSPQTMISKSRRPAVCFRICKTDYRHGRHQEYTAITVRRSNPVFEVTRVTHRKNRFSWSPNSGTLRQRCGGGEGFAG
jgi:hypothetical protein